MEDLILRLLESQGIWTVLFVFLLLYTIKKNDTLDNIEKLREEKYQELLTALTDKFKVLTAINEKMERLCHQLTEKNDN